eukprot:6179756-Karenia_brevis.AAC.1
MTMIRTRTMTVTMTMTATCGTTMPRPTGRKIARSKKPWGCSANANNTRLQHPVGQASGCPAAFCYLKIDDIRL